MKLEAGVRKYKYMILVFLLAFLPRVVFLLWTYPMSITGDEFFAMMPVAKYLGYDWSIGLASYRYYGFGYSVLLLPFFLLFKDPVVLYRMMVLLMILAQSVIAPISYHLMKKYLKVEKEGHLCVYATICSYLVAVRAVYTYPEFIYVLVVWLLVWVLFRLCEQVENKKARVYNTLLLLMLLVYAYSVHSRAVALWIGVAAGLLYYGIVYRKSLVSLPTIGVVGVVGYLGITKGISMVTGYVMSGVDIRAIGNVSVSFSVLDQMKNVDYWPAWVNIIVGQLNEAVLITGGLAVIVVMVSLALLWNAVFGKGEVKAKVQQKPIYLVVSMVCMGAIGVTIAGQSVSWLVGVDAAMRGVGDPDAFRAITYLRYYGAYMGPVMMMGLAYFYHNREQYLGWYRGAAVAVVLLQGYWVLCILPYIKGFGGSVWDVAPYSGAKGFVDEIRFLSYLPATIMVVLVFASSYFLYKYKKDLVVWAVLDVILVYSYCYNAVNHEGYRGQINYAAVEETLAVLADMEAEGTLPEVIYVEDTYAPGGGQQTKYLYQFCMPTVPCKVGLPEGDTKGVYVAQHPETGASLLEQGYECYEVTEGQYMYINYR